MLVQPDERLLRAVVALKTRPEGQAFFEWLAQSYKGTLAALVDANEDIHMRREQGAADTLRTINSIVESADRLTKPRT